LRRVILEKSFSDDVKLPKEAIVVSAMNPEDTRGVQELTGHMKDAIDIIHAEPNWPQFRKHLQEYGEKDLKDVNPTAVNVALQIIDLMVKDLSLHQVKPSEGIHNDNRQFYIAIGDETSYISPREIESLFEDLARAIARVISRIDTLDPDTVRPALVNAAARKIDHTLNMVDVKNDVDTREVRELFKKHLDHVFEDLMEKKVEPASLEDMLDRTLNNPEVHLKDDPNFINLIKNFNANKFTSDLVNYFHKLMDQEPEGKPSHALIKNTHPSKTLRGKSIEKGEENAVSKIEYVIQEIKHACEAHKVGADIMDLIRTSVGEVFERLGEGDPTDEEMQIMQDKIQEYL
jgi:hypothetical protein